MNFVEEFKAGQKGFNLGLSTGLPKLDMAINGVQKKSSYGVCAAPKCGKTTFADFCFVLSPYLQMEEEGRLDDIEWIYYSYEIDRVSKEFKFASFFMAYDYDIWNFEYMGKSYKMTQDYLQGKLTRGTGKYDSKGREISEPIPVSAEHEKLLKEIYVKRIIPIFGEYDANGKKITPGKIIFIEQQDNPTGMQKFLLSYASQHGELVEEGYTVKEDGKDIAKTRVIGYKEKNPNKYTIVVTDHVRKLLRERGFTMKENIDKWLEYSTSIRNMCRFTFVNIAHSNRGISNVERLRYAGETVYPTSDDVKDSGNLAEESTVLMTLFNPNDEKYNLEKHFGVELEMYPNYRSIHITESRYTECPVHIQTSMFGNVNYFTPLI